MLLLMTSRDQVYCGGCCCLEVGGAPVGRVLGFLLLLNVHQQHLGPEGQRLGFLDQLLVGRVGLHSHHHRPLLGVDLGVQLCVPEICINLKINWKTLNDYYDFFYIHSSSL